MDRSAGLTFILTLLLMGCKSFPDTGVGATDVAISYIEARKDFASALGGAVAEEQGQVYRLVAILGPQYPIGSALDPANPADVVTDACLLPEPPLVSWVAFPAITSSRNVALDASLPGLLGRAASYLSDLGVDLGAQSSVSWRMEDVAQRLSPQAVFQEEISTGTCLEQTAGHDILFVRGIVHAKETFTSTSGFNAGAATSATGPGLRVNVDQSGGFRVEDTAAIPRFHIVTLKPADGVAGRTVGGPELVAPPSEVLERLARLR
ncbi:hypothetical protein [Paracoccus sp. 22332]|uniref:hypothetical protein n=1 Tax=Paracoccus sp. 22332 TaxID=3453913 RepID=UPI003F859934